jgi:hypothetical protein
VKKVGESYVCAQCGAVLPVDRSALPSVVIVSAGGKANVRILKVGGREIHRCESSD